MRQDFPKGSGGIAAWSYEATNRARCPSAEMSAGIIQMGGSKCDCNFYKSLEPGNYIEVQVLYRANYLLEALIKNRTGRFGK